MLRRRLHIKYRWLETLNIQELIIKVKNLNMSCVAKELNIPRHILQSHLNRNGFFQEKHFKRNNVVWNKGLTKEIHSSLAKLGQNVSATMQQKYKNGYINPFLGKQHTKEYKRQKSLLERQFLRQEKRIQWINSHITIFSEAGKRGGILNKGNVLTLEHKRNIVKGCTGINLREKNGSWLSGISKEGYPIEFNKKLKDIIKNRDNYTCQICKTQSVLEIHHIDYVKKNCDLLNLIALCRKCHAKTGFNRCFWMVKLQTQLRVNTN